jgi:hypothetical protein
MDCAQAQSLFQSHLDGELTGSLAAEFATHKLACGSCRRELALLEVTGHVIAADQDVPLLDDEFTDRLIACAVAQRRRWYQRPRNLWALGGGLAAAACLIFAFALPGAQPTEPTHPKPVVLGENEHAESASDLIKQLEVAQQKNPDREDLRELDAALRTYTESIADNAEEGAQMLENYGKDAIMEILESIQLDRARHGKAAKAKTPEDKHDPSAQDL